jgi:hypothetical protein
MAEHDRTWPNVAEHDGRTWPNMTEHDRTWPNMAEHGQTWPNMAEHDRTCRPKMTKHGRTWPSMAEHERVGRLFTRRFQLSEVVMTEWVISGCEQAVSVFSWKEQASPQALCAAARNPCSSGI